MADALLVEPAGQRGSQRESSPTMPTEKSAMRYSPTARSPACMVPDDVRYVRIGSTAVRSKTVRLGLRSTECLFGNCNPGPD